VLHTKPQRHFRRPADGRARGPSGQSHRMSGGGGLSERLQGHPECGQGTRLIQSSFFQRATRFLRVSIKLKPISPVVQRNRQLSFDPFNLLVQR
jgi:hypothetical protein